MMFVRNYDRLRALSSHNRGSQGISAELALVKQDTTKGLWAQVTSQLSEGFMRAFEVMEPSVRAVLRSFWINSRLRNLPADCFLSGTPCWTYLPS